MSNIVRDLRFAVRLLLSKPLFTGLTVATLAIGIGLNTAVFSAIEALLLRPLSGVRNPTEMVQLYRTWPGDFTYGSSSIPHFRDVRDRSRDVFTDVAAWTFISLGIAAEGGADRVVGQMVSANYFNVLGVVAERGRVFVAGEETGDLAHPVAVISHAAWQGRFGGDEGIVGRVVVLNGSPYTIVGVVPERFHGLIPVITPDIWVPLTQLAHVRPDPPNVADLRSSNFMNVIARRAPGVSAEQARARMQTLVAELRQDHPDHYENSGIHLVEQSAAGMHPMFRPAQAAISAVVMAVVAMLLLIACVNVANLALARAQDRWREMAVRLSIGARRAVLVRQLLTESLLLALLAGGVGLLVAWWAIGLGNQVRLPVDGNFSPDLRLSAPVLLFSLGITVVTGMLFGLAPALQATRPALIPSLKGEAPAGGSRSRLSRALVVAQMALSLVLLVCAGLFLRNLAAATHVEKGFTTNNLLLAELNPGLQGYSRARATEFYRRLGDRMREIPGVTTVAFAREVPLGLGGPDRSVTVHGYVPRPNENMSIEYNVVAPGYFETMGIPLTAGRGFDMRDDSAAAAVMVVNRRFAERFFPDGNAMGGVVHTGGADRTIVGVVPTGKYRRLGEEPTAHMYFPQAQMWTPEMTIHIRTAGDPSAVAPMLRAEVAALDANVPVADVRTMEAHLGIALLPARVAGTVLGIFGPLGLFLAAIGMYGVTSYSVGQRTREIGIRMAIGAARGEVVGMVMRQGLAMVAIGGVIGLAAAFAALRLLRGVLYGTGAADPLTFVGVPLVLVGVAALATWIPARRAATVDPVQALRAE